MVFGSGRIAVRHLVEDADRGHDPAVDPPHARRPRTG